MPRTTSGCPIGRWNWLVPTLIHMMPRAGVEEGIAGEPEPGHIIVRRQMLVGDADIDVAEVDDVADVLGGAVVVLSAMVLVLHAPMILRTACATLNCARGYYCNGTPASLITLPHMAARLRRTSVVSAGLPPPTNS